MSKHYNIQISIQEIEEAAPAELDQYGKTKTPARERKVVEVAKIIAGADNLFDVVTRGYEHLGVIKDWEHPKDSESWMK